MIQLKWCMQPAKMSLLSLEQDNETGICTTSVNCGISEVLMDINRKLHVAIEETTSCHKANAKLHFIKNDSTHLMVLEAALGSTLELLSDPRTPIGER